MPDLNLKALNLPSFIELAKLYDAKVIFVSPALVRERYSRIYDKPVPCFHVYGYDQQQEQVSVRFIPTDSYDVPEDNEFYKSCRRLFIKWEKHSKSDLVELLRSLGVAESTITKLTRVKSSTLFELCSDGGIDEDSDGEAITQKTTHKNPKLTYKCHSDLGTQCVVRVRRNGGMFNYCVEIDITEKVAKLEESVRRTLASKLKSIPILDATMIGD